MSREEAIKQLNKLKSFHNGSYGEALNFAIESLKVDLAYDLAYEEVESEEKENPYKDFCEFVAKMVLSDDFEENAGANAEFLCRKLSKLGIVKADEDEWVLVESEGKECQESQ